MIVAAQEWVDLLLVHYRVDASELRRLVPVQLELDSFERTSWVTLIPFRITRSRPIVLPRPAAFLLPGSDFVELNFRTYVRGPDGVPGIWFFSLDASSRAAVAGGRLAYGLPYVHARMHLERDADSVRFSSRRTSGKEECESVCQVSGEARRATPGTLEHFLVERYVLFALRSGGLWSARVHHPPYLLRGVRLELWNENLLPLAGFRSATREAAQYSPGVAVRISSPFRVAEGRKRR